MTLLPYEVTEKLDNISDALVNVQANQESILSKLDRLLESDEKLEQERAELKAQMANSPFGSIMDAINGQ